MHLKPYTLSFLLAFAAQAQAIHFSSTNAYLVTEDQTVNEETWIATGTAQTEGTFKNDLFILAANNLLLNGTYEGNVWGIGSNNAEMGGACERNLRLLGKTIVIQGAVGRNVMTLADTIVIATNAVVEGDLKLLGNSIVIEGHTAGNVSITATRLVTVGGTIAGDAEIVAPAILFSREAHIGGNLTYTASKEIVPGEGVVAGTIERIVPQAPPIFSMTRLLSRSLWFIAALMAGIPFITLFPMTTAMASQLARTAPWKCLLVGFLASGALPLFGIACVSSVIGVPLGALILASWGILLYLSRIIMALMIGTLLLRPGAGASAGRILLAMALGLAIIYLATFFPAIGFPVQLAVIWIGSGALLLALLQKRRLIIQVPQELKQIEELKNKNKNKKSEDI